MRDVTQLVETFPFVRIPSESGGLAVEVCLIAQMGWGAGDRLYSGVARRQRRHGAFIDALDEPSARLGESNFPKGDATSLYSFVVGPGGHPFHRHAGHRIFTAVSGSAGAQLRFSTASAQQIAADPRHFIRAMRYVNIAPDCMFTVRFGGATWHQFAAISSNSRHPVLFALSCHTDELGGQLSPALRARVLANEASIPALTELLPPEVARLLDGLDSDSVPATTLALGAAPASWRHAAGRALRACAGRLRGAWAGATAASGFLAYGGAGHRVRELGEVPPHSLLRDQMGDVAVHHEDSFCLRLGGVDVGVGGAAQLLALVLEGFLRNPPGRVTQLMALRNVLVKPLGLRTSPLGCPVSSLLSSDGKQWFAHRYPVLDQAVNAAGTRAQVILGANDKHLLFRSCVGVEVVDGHRVDITLGTRVHCKNWFGRFYMATIAGLHRRYVAPAMLRLAVECALAQGDGLPRTAGPAANAELA